MVHTVAMARKRVKVLVSGRVQGVFYRAEAAERARKLGLGGYVRNASDGGVEAEFEGDEHDVDAMVEWCREGTPLARVESVEVTEIDSKGDSEFRIRH
jgi:acylphosphatase